MLIGITCIVIGFIFGYLWRDSHLESKNQKVKPTKDAYTNYNERQRAKLRHQSDIDRIKELNLLSTNESKFMRLLQHQFLEHKVIIKDRRFYIADQDNFPIAIFEYRDGIKELRVRDKEDGIPVFLYKAIISNKAINEDKMLLTLKQKN